MNTTNCRTRRSSPGCAKATRTRPPHSSSAMFRSSGDAYANACRSSCAARSPSPTLSKTRTSVRYVDSPPSTTVGRVRSGRGSVPSSTGASRIRFEGSWRRGSATCTSRSPAERTRRRRSRLPVASPWDCARSKPEAVRAVHEALGRLAAQDRGIIELIHFKGMRVAEAAEVMGTTRDAARMRYARALRRLRERLGDSGPETTS